jgi:uncharacterized protein (TIGR03067 family)
MSSEPDRSPSPSFAPNLVTALVHAGVWAASLFCGIALVRQAWSQFNDFQMKLPYMTETCITIAMYVQEYWPVAILSLAIGLLADAMILHWLSGSETRRLLREIWSGLVIALPIAGILLATTAITLPYLKITEGLTKTNAARNAAISAELQKFAGEWEQVFEDEAGNPSVAPAATPAKFSVRRDRFNWNDESGTLTPNSMSRPASLNLFYTAGESSGQIRSGIYRFVGDRLQIVMAAPNAPGDQLPSNFEQRGPNHVLFVFRRKQ